MRTFYSESDLPLAKEDAVVDQELDHGVTVQRKIMAGTRVPPDLIEAYEEKTGTTTVAADTSPGDTVPDYDAMSVEELEAEIAKRDDIDRDAIQGTGKDGNVVKADLVKALSGS
jgi:pyruvate/2-oxoglutarate dehydrogenase complex dihydrolipoamide acyltransferase (E2) component